MRSTCIDAGRGFESLTTHLLLLRIYNLGAGPNGIDAANGLRKIDRNIGFVLMTAFLNPTQLPTLLTKLPSGSKYLIKHSVSEISVLVREIEAAISAKK